MVKLLTRKEILKWVVVGLPAAATVVSAFLPLRPIVQQGLICVMLVWFQISLMLGVFS
jgi:hypothetical protein